MRRACAATLAAVLVLVFAPGAGAMQAPPLPPAVAALAPSLQPQGGGVLKFLGLSIYDGWYWSRERGWSLEQPFALDLHYHRSLAGAKIAERSLEEIARLRIGSKAQRARWGEQMRAIFPDVQKGDRITGVHVRPPRFATSSTASRSGTSSTASSRARSSASGSIRALRSAISATCS